MGGLFRRDQQRGRRVLLGFVRMFDARANRAADVAIGPARIGEQCANRRQTAPATRRAAEAAIGLNRRAGSRDFLAPKRSEDLTIGEDVARTYDHWSRVV